ncbi:MAG: response regulator [Chitinivibrionales bacterium]|nr:response regulator [Chitinivibrionales bacterium]MBD3395124.1 response regulator [Chitinivibrionales bacterium]
MPDQKPESKPVAERNGRILVADDEPSLRLLLSKELSREGYLVDVATDGEEVLARLRDESYHVVLLDIVMPKKDGISVLRTVREENLPTEVIILTGNATVESAIECMKLGAFEYVRKPYSLKELLIQIERAIERQRSRLDIRLLREDLRRTGYGGKLIGKSRAMQEVRKFIARVAATQSTVLILGESGTGKELVARAVHDQSPYRDKPFVAINCATFSETLLESELFGHEKGAFTDAKVQKRGLAEMADGGTLFLDEIGEMPLHFQAKLLRFLETGEIRRVGGTKDIRLNERIICATNKPLEELTARNAFRTDLYYRLNVLSISIPPLRTHREDIVLLVQDSLAGQSQRKELAREALDVLTSYDWPGNVRELKNVIERVCILSTGPVITAEDLSFLSPTRLEPAAQEAPVDVPFDTECLSLKEMERRHIINVLKYTKGHKGKAAKQLQINPKTLYQKMKTYGIVSEYR